ncbi:cytochrome-c peroxidase [Sinirhodobacter ferrireducens]|uniref:Cytochrome-c peroxidase n=1 Tax=Paenirhodobacter ferrireducens TaxID=1215032 RepID=A0A443L9R4_9RHOB|nr:cytochrome-c peroxidase [Sinirhodobacter ferrireducens]RWR45893.1 cytochrome-c peroxidase [Sinirhodobacter ferrireducens]
MKPVLAALTLIGAQAGVAVAANPAIDDDALRSDAQGVFEPIPQAPDPAPAPAQAELGKMLFFEPRLSEAHNISCNTCHNLSTGGVDLSSVSLGHRWQKGGRNSPTVLNSTYNFAQFWDGRAANLIEQAGGPMQNPVEMASNPNHVIEMLKAIPGYTPIFATAFPDATDPVTFENATAAIAAFEDTLITPNAPFDRWLKGDDAAMTEEQKQGLSLFMSEGCSSCHNGMNIGGNSYQVFGVVAKPDPSILPPEDMGRYAVTKDEADKYAYKVPTLRNIALTAPYFHSGAVWDLKEAVKVMADAQLGAQLDDQQLGQIVAFLGSLTGDMPQIVYPVLPASVAGTPHPMP